MTTTSSTPFLGDSDRFEQVSNDSPASPQPALDDPDRRRLVLQAPGAPLVFAHPDFMVYPITTDPDLSNWLAGYFVRGAGWENLIASRGGGEPALEDILSGQEFNAFAVQGQWYLSLLPTERYCTQLRVRVQNLLGTHSEVRLRLPLDYQETAHQRMLALFKDQIEQFPAALGEWFDEVHAEIGGWLSNRYGSLNPTRTRFVRWFREHVGVLEFGLTWETIAPNFHVAVISFEEKEVSDEFTRMIHRYCQEQVQRLKTESQAEADRMERIRDAADGPAKQGVALGDKDTIRPLFKNEETYQRALQALREVHPPLLSRNKHELRWIGKRGGKSGLIAWIEVLEGPGGTIPKITDRSRLAQCLMNTFAGLTMDTNKASLWNKLTEAGTRYQAEFLSLLN